jgi:hypothetical protein
MMTTLLEGFQHRAVRLAGTADMKPADSAEYPPSTGAALSGDAGVLVAERKGRVLVASRVEILGRIARRVAPERGVIGGFETARTPRPPAIRRISSCEAKRAQPGLRPLELTESRDRVCAAAMPENAAPHGSKPLSSPLSSQLGVQSGRAVHARLKPAGYRPDTTLTPSLVHLR